MTPHPDADETALAPFLAAARAADDGPRPALISAILADAADVHAARRAAPPARKTGLRLASLIEPLGGWRGLAALGACAAIGVWLGIAGSISIDGATLTADATSESALEEVDAFFDYAALEQ